MSMKVVLFFLAILFQGRPMAWADASNVENNSKDFLIKLRPASQELLEQKANTLVQRMQEQGAKVERFSFGPWMRVQLSENNSSSKSSQSLYQVMKNHPDIEFVQPNYRIKLLENPALHNAGVAAKINQIMRDGRRLPPGPTAPKKDNPEIPAPNRSETRGEDPELSKQWGMQKIGVRKAWERTTGSKNIIVAVLDTGVDYTHEDLLNNIWRNPGEAGVDASGNNKGTNKIDDDGNGYIDDTIGWDFVTNDARPYDLTLGLMEIITQGGNPGHGSHCAGNVAARMQNGKGIAGVAPNVAIMPLRFLSEKGQGTTSDAVKAIEYAVRNGAQVLSNSWGSEGEDSDTNSNRALKEAINFSEEQGTLFIAAAGNGHQGKGYDNDSDPKPAYPASYDMENIISVAAINDQDQLGAFSNWGLRTVDLGAPGVKILSTVPGNLYQDTILDLFGMKVTWDGTSMATPHVAGAAALYWSLHPEKNWREVKDAVLSSAASTPALEGKTVTGGKLDVGSLIHNH